MRGTCLVAMMVIMSGVLMSVCESARISVEIPKKMTTPEEGANDEWSPTCGLCDYSPSPGLCRSLLCDHVVPVLTHLKEEDNDWKDTACSWCAFTFSPRQCVRTCRRGLPELTLLKEETNDWKDTVGQIVPPVGYICKGICSDQPSSYNCRRCREMGYGQ